MIELVYQIELWVCVAAAALTTALAVMGRKPSLFSVSALGVVELGLVVQLLLSIALVIGGAQAKQDTVEFFGYLITALIVPVAAVLWGLVERTRWSTAILAVSALTVAVMLARMEQIWTGTHF